MAIHRFFLSACAVLSLTSPMLSARSNPDLIKDRLLPAAALGAAISGLGYFCGKIIENSGIELFSKVGLYYTLPLTVFFALLSLPISESNSNHQDPTHEN